MTLVEVIVNLIGGLPTDPMGIVIYTCACVILLEVIRDLLDLLHTLVKVISKIA